MAAILVGCGGDDAPRVSSSSAATGPTGTPTGESVVVVGAGPAGMSAAHLLRQRGVDTRVLEAVPTHGGRIQHDREFADFPISLGGESVHVDGAVHEADRVIVTVPLRILQRRDITFTPALEDDRIETIDAVTV
jgi:monoamine oxidase